MNARLILLALMALPTVGHGQCRLCADPQAGVATPPTRPLEIAIETALDFSRAAGTRGGGSIVVDPQSGMRAVSGLGDVGGIAIRGIVRLTGEPYRHVRVSLPASVRLLASDGGAAEAVDLRTDLPTDPALDAQGNLSFSFGGRMIVAGDAAGEFRGRIPVTADYQ